MDLLKTEGNYLQEFLKKTNNDNEEILVYGNNLMTLTSMQSLYLESLLDEFTLNITMDSWMNRADGLFGDT